MPTILTPYLSFDGNTREAFAFYEKALGARIETMMSYAEMPGRRWRQRLWRRPAAQRRRHHARVPGAAWRRDAVCRRHPARHASRGHEGRMLALEYDTVDQAHTAFQALSQGGQVTMPLAPAFWAKVFGMLTDRFGVSWAVNGEPIKFG